VNRNKKIVNKNEMVVINFQLLNTNSISTLMITGTEFVQFNEMINELITALSVTITIQ